MIENLRKYTGLIIVLFILVIIGFLFMDTSTMRASGGGQPYIKVAGRNYTDKEFRTLGDSSFELTQSLMQTGDFSLYTFLLSLSGNADSEQQMRENFFTSRMLLRSAKTEFGIYPSDEQIDTFIRQMRAFTGPDGAFSQEQYRNFIEKGIGRLGLTENDVRELASDVIAQRKIAEILGSGLYGNREIIAKDQALEGQSVRTNVVRIDIDPIEAEIDPSAEEIKLYWETIQDAFKSEEQRRFTYLIATPEATEEPEALPAPAADASDEAKAEYETKKAELEAATAEARRTAQLATDEKVDDFLFQLEENKDLTFEKLAEKDGWELKTTELFSLSNVPEELRTALRSSSAQGTAANELFRMQVTSDPFSKISPAIAIGENQWLIARLDESVPVRTQTFEEARDEARARLIAEKADAALKQAAEDAIAKIKVSLEEGKTFAEAAKAAGLINEALNLTEVSAGYQPDTTKIPANLFDVAKYVTPGDIAEPVIESDRAFIVHVETREIVKTDATDIEAAVENATAQNEIAAFTAWLSAKAEAADIQPLYRQ
ncbi:MAG: SurA N-terminal domain-containing protein [Luteolibacter sp.]